MPYYMGTDPDSKVYVANMGPIWGRQDPGGPHAGPMIFAIWGPMTTHWTLGDLNTILDNRVISITYEWSTSDIVDNYLQYLESKTPRCQWKYNSNFPCIQNKIRQRLSKALYVWSVNENLQVLRIIFLPSE